MYYVYICKYVQFFLSIIIFKKFKFNFFINFYHLLYLHFFRKNLFFAKKNTRLEKKKEEGKRRKQ